MIMGIKWMKKNWDIIIHCHLMLTIKENNILLAFAMRNKTGF